MKKIFLFILGLAFIVGSCSNQVNTDVAKEEEAIKELLQKEQDLWLAQDYESECEMFKKADYVANVYNQGNYHGLKIGWDSIYASISKTNIDWSLATNTKVECRDFHIKVYNDVACAVYYSQMTGEWKGEPYDISVSRMSVLEKEADSWKIAFNYATRLNPCPEQENIDAED